MPWHSRAWLGWSHRKGADSGNPLVDPCQVPTAYPTFAVDGVLGAGMGRQGPGRCLWHRPRPLGLSVLSRGHGAFEGSGLDF